MRMFVPVKLDKDSRNGTDIRMRRESHRFGGERLPSGYHGAAIDREMDAKRLARHRNRWLNMAVADGVEDWRSGLVGPFAPEPVSFTDTASVVSCGLLEEYEEELDLNGGAPEGYWFIPLRQANLTREMGSPNRRRF